MPLGTAVDLHTGHIVLDGFPALRERHTASPSFRPASLVKDSIPFSHARCDLILPKFLIGKNYSVHIPTRDEWTNNRVIIPDDIVCYMDCSKLL